MKKRCQALCGIIFDKVVPLWAAGAGRRTDRPTKGASTWVWFPHHPPGLELDLSQLQEHPTGGRGRRPIQRPRPSVPTERALSRSPYVILGSPRVVTHGARGLWSSETPSGRPWPAPSLPPGGQFLTRPSQRASAKGLPRLHLYIRMMKRCYPVLGFPSEKDKSHYPPVLTLGKSSCWSFSGRPRTCYTALGGALEVEPPTRSTGWRPWPVTASVIKS